MAPLGSPAAAAARAARPRSRSRSRSAEPKPSAASSRAQALPQLKDWVLTRVSTRFWSKAVPALVSRVTVGIKPEDCSLCLVLPNRFALQYGFGVAKPFFELSDVPVRDVRPYHGTDHLLLHATLLKAIRESRSGSQASREGCSTVATSTIARNVDLRAGGISPASATPAALTQLAKPAEPADLVPGMTQDDEIPAAQPEPAVSEEDEEEMEEDRLSLPRSPPERAGEEADDKSKESEPAVRSRPPTAAESEMELESTQEVPLEDQLASGPPPQPQPQPEEAARGDEPPPTTAAAPLSPAAVVHATATPETPRRTSQGRPLAQRESEPKDASNTVVEPVAVPMGKISPVLAMAEKAAPVNAAARFAELTKAVARAFKGARADELTRQELAKAVGHSFGEEELHQGLEQLDRAQKIFLTGDLVFLI